MDKQSLPIFDVKNKVIVLRADSYHSMSPVRLLQPNETVENIGRKFTLSGATSVTPKVCVIGNTTIRKLCDTCANNQPTCSSHTCFSNNIVDAGSQRRLPIILKKRNTVKSLPKIAIDPKRNVYERNLTKSSFVDNKNLPTKQTYELLGSTIPLKASCSSSKLQCPNMEITANNENYDAATVMDLLNKQCGDILETQLSSEMKQANSTHIAPDVEIKSNTETGCNPGISTDLQYQIQGVLVNKQSVETVLTALMDSPNENYQLFTEKEVKQVPEKIFESPQRSFPQQLNETVSSTSLSNFIKYNLNGTQVMNNETKDLKDISISESNLEFLSNSPSKVTGDESRDKANETTNSSLHYLVKDTLEVGGTEQQEITAENGRETNVSEKSYKDESANLPIESTIISSKLKALGKQQLWEIKPQDINFDIITSTIASPKFQEISLCNQPAQNNLLSTELRDAASTEEVTKNIRENLNKYFGDLLKIIPKESLEVDNPNLNKISEKTRGTVNLISSEVLIDSTGGINDVIPSDNGIDLNAVNSVPQDFIGDTSPYTENITASNTTSRENNSTEIVSAEPAEINRCADIRKISSKFASTEPTQYCTKSNNLTPNTVMKSGAGNKSDSFVFEEHIDINNCDILVLKADGVLEPLNIEPNINVPSVVHNKNVSEKVTEECKAQETVPMLELEDLCLSVNQNVENINDYVIEKCANLDLSTVDVAENLTESKLLEESASEGLRLCVNDGNENTNEHTVELYPASSNSCSTVGDTVKITSTVELQNINSLEGIEQDDHIIEVPLKSNSGSGAETTNKYKAMTESERLDLRNRIMEGKISREELLDIIESQNIIQYNIIAEPLTENHKWNQQKRDARYLSECLKKQIDVMKKTYEYFENIIESALKALDGDLTEGGLKSILDNLYFVKNIVDKTLVFYDVGRWKQNKVRYKVINITRKDVKNGSRSQTFARNVNCKAKKTKKSSNKLIPKTLYRMNRLLEQLETHNNLLCKRKQNKFVAKLREIAKKDLCNNFTAKSKKVIVSAKEEKRKEQIATVVEKQTKVMSIHSDDSDCDAQETTHTYAGNTEKTNKGNIEDIQKESKNIIDVNKPIITPLSEGVKRIFSQIEQLNKYRSVRTVREISTVGENVAAVAKLDNRNIMQRTTSVPKDDKKGIAETAISTVAEKDDSNQENNFKKKLKKKIVNGNRKTNEVTANAHPRYSQRYRKQPDFYSADKYSASLPKDTKTRGRSKYVLDFSFLPQRSTRFAKYDNLEFELKNDDKPCVVLYDKTDTPNVSIFKNDDQNPEKKAAEDENVIGGQTVRKSDDNKTKALSEKNSNDVTKRVLRKRTVKYESVKRELRSTSINQKNGIRK